MTSVGIEAADVSVYQKSLEQKKYRSALDFLKQEAVQIDRALTDALQVAFPKVSGPWVLEPKHNTGDSGKLSASGISINFFYKGQNTEQTLTLSLLADHPDIEEYRRLILNPSAYQSQGIDAIRVQKKYQGIKKYDVASNTVEVNVLLSKNILLSAAGTAVKSADDVLKVFEEIDLELIRNVLI